jgi:hypothetical protein
MIGSYNKIHSINLCGRKTARPVTLYCMVSHLLLMDTTSLMKLPYSLEEQDDKTSTVVTHASRAIIKPQIKQGIATSRIIVALI